MRKIGNSLESLVDTSASISDDNSTLSPKNFLKSNKLAGMKPKAYQVMDNIYKRNYKKINNHIQKLEPDMRPHAHNLFFNKKVEVHQMIKDHNAQEHKNINRMLRKTEVPVNHL